MAKGTKIADLRGQTDEQLAEFVKATTADILTARFQNYTNQLNDTSRVGKLRRDLARAVTLQAERKGAAAKTNTTVAQGAGQ